MQLWSRIRHLATTMLMATLAWGGAAGANTFGLQLLVSGLTNPVALANAGDGSNRLFIVDQTGIIKIYDGTQVLATPFLNITSKVLSGGERGLLGLAFDANYASNGFFYVFYTSQPAGDVTIARYSVTADPSVANPNSELILKTQAHPTFANHNGGALVFGPDGCLYAGIGDGGGGGDPDNNGQNLGTLLGKIIRISPSDGTPCAAAPGNPFVGTPGARGEIWALGLRNPWRITFDRQTGDLLIADVGQNSREEVNFQPAAAAGRNYCWRRKEGTLIFDANIPCTAGTPTDPVLEYDHSGGNCSITGGYRYRGSKFPGFVGTYFYGDFCSGRIWGATESGGAWTTVELLDTALNISSFGEDEAGEIYVAHLSGALYRLGGVGMNTHDFNADGKSDIVWRQSDGTVAVWLMNGAQVSQSWRSSARCPPTGRSSGSATSTATETTIWLWRDANTGTVAIWLLNGLQVLRLGVSARYRATGRSSARRTSTATARATFSGATHDTGTLAIWLLNGLQIITVREYRRGAEQLDRRRHGRLQRRRQGRHSLARQQHRHGGDLARERQLQVSQSGSSRHGAQQLDDRRHRRLQRRRQGRYSLARQQHRHGGDLAGERPAVSSQTGSIGAVPSNWTWPRPAISTATARATFSGATPPPARRRSGS